MAVRTVAAGGGNFNVGATWVGGVAPVANDSIIADATSGNLTLSANTVNLTGANFTGYTGTLALVTFEFRMTSGSLILGSGMTITKTAGNNGYISGQNAYSLTSNGVVVPMIGGNVLVTLTGDLTMITPRTATQWTGSDVIITGTVLGSNSNSITIASPNKVILRPSGPLSIQNTSNNFQIAGNIQIDTEFLITPQNVFLWDGAIITNLEITKNTSWAAGFPLFQLSNNTTFNVNSYTYSFNMGTVWAFVATSGSNKLNFLSGSVSIDTLQITANPTSTSFNTTTATLAGTYSPIIKNLWVPSYAVVTSTGLAQKSGVLNLKPGLTYSVTNTLFLGGPGSVKGTLSNGGSASRAGILFTGNTYSITNVNLNNISFASTNPLYYLNNTGVSLTNTTGISLAGSGGGGGGSFTFVL